MLCTFDAVPEMPSGKRVIFGWIRPCASLPDLFDQQSLNRVSGIVWTEWTRLRQCWHIDIRRPLDRGIKSYWQHWAPWIHQRYLLPGQKKKIDFPAFITYNGRRSMSSILKLEVYQRSAEAKPTCQRVIKKKQVTEWGPSKSVDGKFRTSQFQPYSFYTYRRDVQYKMDTSWGRLPYVRCQRT